MITLDPRTTPLHDIRTGDILVWTNGDQYIVIDTTGQTLQVRTAQSFHTPGHVTNANYSYCERILR